MNRASDWRGVYRKTHEEWESSTGSIPTFWSRTRRVLPWLGSIFLVGWIVMRRDFSEVIDVLLMADWLPILVCWLVYTLVTVFLDAGFLYTLLRSTGRRASYSAFLIIRSQTYLLSAVHGAFGAGALIVWFKRRFQIPWLTASGLMGLEVVFELATLGFLGLWASWLGRMSGLGDPSLLDALETFGLVAVGISVALIGGLRWRGKLKIRMKNLGWLGSIKLAQNLVHGLFVIALMRCFDLQVVFWDGLGAAQIVRTARSLPVAVLGVGVDQIAFETIVSHPNLDRLLACSLIYTGSMLLGRLVPGLISLPWGIGIWQNEDHDEIQQESAD